MPGNENLSAVETGLVNVMSRETVLRQYVDSVKRDYDYVLLDCRPSLGMLVINAPVRIGLCACPLCRQNIFSAANVKRR